MQEPYHFMDYYGSYIAHLSIRKLCDTQGNIYYGINRDVQDSLRSKLIQAVLLFEI